MLLLRSKFTWVTDEVFEKIIAPFFLRSAEYGSPLRCKESPYIVKELIKLIILEPLVPSICQVTLQSMSLKGFKSSRKSGFDPLVCIRQIFEFPVDGNRDNGRGIAWREGRRQLLHRFRHVIVVRARLAQHALSRVKMWCCKARSAQQVLSRVTI